MDEFLETEISKLQDKILQAERERDVWRGKRSENFKMASIMVDALRRQLAGLVRKREH